MGIFQRLILSVNQIQLFFVVVVVVWFSLVLFLDTINLRCLRDNYIKVSVLSGTLLNSKKRDRFVKV